jgi:hypothetical protein
MISGGVVLLLSAPGAMAAECVVTTFGPLSLASTASAPAAGQQGRALLRARKPALPTSLRVCVTNFQGRGEVPVGVQLYDARDARSALVEEVVHLRSGEGDCMALQIEGRGDRPRVRQVFAAVSVQAESIDRSPVITSAEPGGGVQFVGLLLPAVQKVREPCPDCPPPPPPV